VLKEWHRSPLRWITLLLVEEAQLEQNMVHLECAFRVGFKRDAKKKLGGRGGPPEARGKFTSVIFSSFSKKAFRAASLVGL
jgi:hypothetical protein